tara:strand:+ start:13486 stop:14364 length:879 start_codon:yes stop_codon:yes gene_type:complete
MANIFNPGGGASEITELGANNWKTFYSNGSGTITELALGADGTALVGNGASSAPTYGNITDIKGGNDKVLFTNSSGVLTELAIGATGTFLKSAGTTSNPTWGSGGGNWAQIAGGTYSAGSATLMSLTSLSNYRSLRGWFVFPETDDGTAATLKWTANGKTSHYYTLGAMEDGTTVTGIATAPASGATDTAYGVTPRTFFTGYGNFNIYFLAQGKDTTNRGVVAGTVDVWSRYDDAAGPGTTGSRATTYFMIDEPMTSDTGITEWIMSIGTAGRTIEVNSGYNAYYVEAYTAS